jgi:hypothetical protein
MYLFLHIIFAFFTPGGKEKNEIEPGAGIGYCR